MTVAEAPLDVLPTPRLIWDKRITDARGGAFPRYYAATAQLIPAPGTSRDSGR